MLAAILGTSKTYEEEVLLEVLKDKAKVNCNRCMGRGHVGYIDEMIPKGHIKGEPKIPLKVKFYYPCTKCLIEEDDALNIKL